MVAGLQQLPVVLLGFRACAAGAVCAHCRVSTVQIEPKKAMEKVSVKTLRGAALPTNQPPPVLYLLSFKEHEVSVDRGEGLATLARMKIFSKKIGRINGNRFCHR